MEGDTDDTTSVSSEGREPPFWLLETACLPSGHNPLVFTSTWSQFNCKRGQEICPCLGPGGAGDW